MSEICFICVDSPYTDEVPDVSTHCGCIFHERCLNKRIMEGYTKCARCLESNIEAGLMCTNDGNNLQMYPNLSDDILIVLAAVKSTGSAIMFASGPALKCLDIAQIAVKTFPKAIDYVDDDIITKELILLALDNCQSGEVPFKLPSVFANDIEVAKKIVSIDGLELENVSLTCCEDFDVNFLAVQQNGLALEFVDSAWRGDRRIADAAVAQNGLALEFATRQIKNNARVVMEAMKNNVLAYNFASSDLKSHSRILELKTQLKTQQES